MTGTLAGREPGERIRLLVAEDEFLVRLYLRQALSSPEIEVVAEAADGAEAVDLALKYEPDVSLLDLQMPRLSGIEAARRIKEALPSAKMVALTASESEEDLDQALRAGFTGYLLKDEWYFLEEYVRRAHRGEVVLSPRVGPRLIKLYTAPRREEKEEGPGLTGAEHAVLCLLAERLTYREIAERRYTTLDTVKKQVGAVYGKLGAEGWRDAVDKARRLGLIGETPTTVLTGHEGLRIVLSRDAHRGFEQYTRHYHVTVAAFMEALGWYLDPSAWGPIQLNAKFDEYLASAQQIDEERRRRLPTRTHALRVRLSHQAHGNWVAFAQQFHLSLTATLEALGLLVHKRSEWARWEESLPHLKPTLALAQEITARRHRRTAAA